LWSFPVLLVVIALIIIGLAKLMDETAVATIVALAIIATVLLRIVFAWRTRRITY